MVIAKKAPAKRVSNAAAKASGSDATDLLVKDHKEVKTLFKQYEQLVKSEAAGEQRKELAETICTMLTVHAAIEEEIFYPASRAALEESDLLDEAEVEHASAKTLIAEIRAMETGDDLYDAKVTVLGEYVNHHVQEEEGEMFPKCRKSDMDLDALASELQQRKSQLLAEMTEGSTAA
jgi:hemerythrin superfamily protein